MPGGRATRPGDILTGASGTTVEVLNTDAEGRLILGDALWYARQCGATHLVDVATLTGACVIALGGAASGLFARPREWSEAVQAAAARAGERVWPMPLYEDYREQLRSELADIKNIGGSRRGSVYRGGVPRGVHRRTALGAPGHRRHGLDREAARGRRGRRHRGHGAHADRVGAREPELVGCCSWSPNPSR